MEERQCSNFALIFFLIAIVAAVFGFGGIDGCFCRHREDPVRSIPGSVLARFSHGCCPPSITAEQRRELPWARRLLSAGFFCVSVLKTCHSYIRIDTCAFLNIS